jgi:phosphate starvation-inducible PhoH-like protein
METLYSKEKIKKCITEGLIEIIPFAFLRGRNFVNCVAVIDEGQNITNTQMKLLLGRICNGSKIIICGDTDQIDLKDPKQSGLDFICTNMKEIPGFAVIDLHTNHRDSIVEEILKVYEKNGK